MDIPERMAATSADLRIDVGELATKYRDSPVKLSAKALGKPTEFLRPLRRGSKWGLPG
jgi:hypothetical protein